MKISVQHFNHVALHVRDLERSQKFYVETLGFPLLPRPGFGFPGAWIGLADGELHLIVEPDMKEPTGSHHFALLVESIFPIQKYLDEAGVPTHSRSFRPDGYDQLYILDPDGYQIEFYSKASEEKV
ncbi:MAG: VOC family protein [Chthonomonadaceae bacterium]|nr:VOC family protein [Chthonomonadaceae bacterium]